MHCKHDSTAPWDRLIGVACAVAGAHDCTDSTADLSVRRYGETRLKTAPATGILTRTMASPQNKAGLATFIDRTASQQNMSDRQTAFGRKWNTGFSNKAFT